MIKAKSDTRQRIYDILVYRPGLHLSKIAELLSLNIAVVEDHLQYLEETGKIIRKHIAGYDQYFIKTAEKKPSYRKKSEEIKRALYEVICQHPGIPTRKIAEHVEVSSSLLDQYLIALEEKGDIAVLKEESDIKYYIANKKKRVRKDKRADDIRKKIYNLIAENPGLHMSKIAAILGMNLSLARYHLNYMQHNDIISSIRDKKGYYKRYYLAESDFGIQEKKVLSLLRQKYLLEIILLLIKEKSMQPKQLCNHLHISPSLLSYYLTKLTEYGIVDVSSYGKDKGYFLTNRNDIIRIIEKHQVHIQLHLSLESLKDAWKDFQLV